MKIDKIIIQGEKRVGDSASTDLLELQGSYHIIGATRGATEVHEIDVDEDSLVEWEFEDDTVWLSTPSTMDEIFPEALVKRRGGEDGAVEIPTAIMMADGERGGIIKKILVKVVRIFTRKKGVVDIKAVASRLELKAIGMEPDVYRVKADFTFEKFKAPATDTGEPYLLFLHGTASSTQKSFGKLVEAKLLWENMRTKYGDRILGFQHESLTKSPLQNVIDLIGGLPKSCTLHLISQSHGGLVGEVLSRFFNNDGTTVGFSQIEIDLFTKENQNDDVKNIGLLIKAASTRQITIERFIRVACPAGGTTLASQRTDHVLNVIMNLLGIAAAGNFLFPMFKDLIAAAIGAKNDAETLPGLEALKPDSAFMRATTFPASTVRIDNSLAIISGNAKVSLSFRALLVAITKAFFRQDNDFVVDTESMYSGTSRTGRVQFFFDEGPKVHHFAYFENTNTVTALANALTTNNGDPIPGFVERTITPFEIHRGIIPGQEGGQLKPKPVSGAKPILLVLPGIMGSNLAQKERLVWINYLGFLTGNLKRLNINAADINAPSIVRTSYKKLDDHFSSQYDVVVFPYDWRMQLANRAKLLKDKIEELMEFNQPIKIIGHSMGGVLMRDFMVYFTDTWERLNASPGFKLVFLGAPLAGSFRIVSVLFGQDSLIDKLARIDVFHSKAELLDIFSKLPGLLSLLPHSTTQDMASPATWKAMKDAYGVEDWPTPPDTALREFERYRTRINDFLASMDYTNISYIAGQDSSTPSGFRIDNNAGKKELVFLSTAEGDQSVTWETGIPTKMISADSVYYSDVVHGQLANEPKLFTGISELLIHGRTNQLSRSRPVVRGEEKEFRSPVIHDFDLSEMGVERTILGIQDTDSKSAQQVPVRAFVTKGDVKFAAFPVLSGHFLNDGILYSELAIDVLLNKDLTLRHQLADYPGRIGTSEVFDGNENFSGALIVGIGEAGKLTPFQLAKTVEEGVAKYLLDLNRDNTKGIKLTQPGISALMIGCGYGGLSYENSTRAIMQGVMKANEKIRKIVSGTPRTIEVVEFVELYSDRALNCLYALSKIEAEQNSDMPITLERKTLVVRPGSRDRIPVDATEGWWSRIKVELEDDRVVSGTREIVKRHAQSFRFTLSTGGAREEVRDHQVSKELIDKMLKEISVDRGWNGVMAKTVFDLLIPNDFKEQIKKQNNINLIVDINTASYPWELLQDGAGQNVKPLCVNAGMIRQLATLNFDINVKTVVRNRALVIADPDLKGSHSQLPDAQKEGERVLALLKENQYETLDAINTSYSDVIQRLFGDDEKYKIIHFAGHGFFDETEPESGGMLIGDNTFLTWRELANLDPIPELVIINCCFLGKVSSAAEQLYHERYKMAANIGTGLIQKGVKAVIAAGWEVNDSAALSFTEIFYRSMFAGYNFGDSILKARQHVFANFPGNTWGAYQCYGDPFYRLTNDYTKQPDKDINFITEEEALVSLGNLYNDIELGGSAANQFEKLKAISAAIDRGGVATGPVTAKLASALVGLCEYDLAMAQFSNMLKLESAGFSLTSLRDYCELRAILALRDFRKTPSAGARLTRRIDEVIHDVVSMLALGVTADRCLLLGNMYRLKALMIKARAPKIAAYSQAAYYYLEALMQNETIAAGYALVYFVETEEMLQGINKTHAWGKKVRTSKGTYQLPTQKFIKQKIDQLRNKSIASFADVTDYWNLLMPASLDVLQWLDAPGEDPNAVSNLLASYSRVWKKLGSPGKKCEEISRLDILLDLVSMNKSRKAGLLKKGIESLKVGLGKLI